MKREIKFDRRPDGVVRLRVPSDWPDTPHTKHVTKDQFDAIRPWGAGDAGALVLKLVSGPQDRAFLVSESHQMAKIWVNHRPVWICRSALRALGIRLKRGEVRWYRLEVPS